MYKSCPKCGYKRKPTDTTRDNQCPGCGLLFDKWLKHRYRQAVDTSQSPRTRGWDFSRLLVTLIEYDRPQERWIKYGRLLLLFVLLVWGWQFIQMDHRLLEHGLPDINQSFLHGVNLVFHEAGHILFIPLGEFMTVLGGSLGQVIMPAVAMGALLRHGDPFGASVGLWWLSQSLMDLAPYVYDARHGRMLLLGGVTGRDRPGYHDWSNILKDLGLLDYSHVIAAAVDGLGVLFMLTAIAWGAYVLWHNWR